MAGKMPVISVTGPRQSGKTTLCKQCFPKYDYVNLESPDTLEDAKSDPVAFLKRPKHGLIIDEAQLYPEIFSYIQAISDESGKPGQFIISGSQNFLLSAKISQSLAGRIFITHLLPLSISEIRKTDFWDNDYKELMFKGFYPRLYDRNIPAHLFYPSYIQTYCERDVRQIINVSDLFTFQKFMRLAAGRVGQLLNYSEIAAELGIDLKTVKSWFSILETSFIVFFLQPHHKNYNKRLVKSPKLYFYDTGLACSLLGIKKADELETHWAKGALFENMIICDLTKNYFNSAQPAPLFFWRDNTGNELDCIVDEGKALKTVEIKSGSTLNMNFFKSLNYYNSLSHGKASNSYLIYGGTKQVQRKEGNVLSWKNTSAVM